MKICLITHGGTPCGMGHVMRSLSLAGAFRERRHDVMFLSKYAEGIRVIQSQKFNVLPLKSQCDNITECFNYGTSEELRFEENEIKSVLEKEAFDCIVIDSYNVDEKYFLYLKEYTKLVIYIDDIYAFEYPVDIVLNGSSAALAMGYKMKQGCLYLLGLEFNLLREEFRGIKKRRVNKVVRDILITTGNSDPYCVTEKIVSYIKDGTLEKNINLHVIVGSGFKKKNNLFNKEESHNIKLYNSPRGIVRIMKKCDLSITAGGSTLYELCAIGVPIIAFSYATNQKPQVDIMEKMGLIKSLGHYDEINKKKLIQLINYYIANYNERKANVEKIQNLIDGSGSIRAVQCIEQRFKRDIL